MKKLRSETSRWKSSLWGAEQGLRWRPTTDLRTWVPVRRPISPNLNPLVPAGVHGLTVMPASYRVKQRRKTLSSRTFHACFQHSLVFTTPSPLWTSLLGEASSSLSQCACLPLRESLHVHGTLKQIHFPIPHAVTSDRFTKLALLLPPLSGGGAGPFRRERTRAQKGTEHPILGPPAAHTHFNVTFKKPSEIILDKLC